MVRILGPSLESFNMNDPPPPPSSLTACSILSALSQHLRAALLCAHVHAGTRAEWTDTTTDVCTDRETDRQIETQKRDR